MPDLKGITDFPNRSAQLEEFLEIWGGDWGGTSKDRMTYNLLFKVAIFLRGNLEIRCNFMRLPVPIQSLATHAYQWYYYQLYCS